MLRRPSPGETYKYVDGVVDRFNKYVEQQILPAISNTSLSHAQRLTGLNYILVNALTEYDLELIEVLTSYYTGKQASEVYETAIRVAQQREIAPARLVKALGTALTGKPHRQRDLIYLRRLRELDGTAGLILLDMIKPQQEGKMRRRIVRLIRDVTHVKAPAGTIEWARADAQKLEKLSRDYEQLIDPTGEIRKTVVETARKAAEAKAAEDAEQKPDEKLKPAVSDSPAENGE